MSVPALKMLPPPAPRFYEHRLSGVTLCEEHAPHGPAWRELDGWDQMLRIVCRGPMKCAECALEECHD